MQSHCETLPDQSDTVLYQFCTIVNYSGPSSRKVLQHMPKFKHVSISVNFNGATNILKVRYVLKYLAELGV